MKSDRPSPTCGRTGKKLPTAVGHYEKGDKILKFYFIIMIVIMIIG
jgi:hypothetical protein